MDPRVPAGFRFLSLSSVVHSVHAYMASFHYDLAYSGIQVYIAFGSELTKAKQFAFASQLSWFQTYKR